MDPAPSSFRQLKLFSTESPLITRLGVDFFRALPGKPGVYFFHDDTGKLLYIGQSADLKARLGSYRHVTPEKNPKRTLRLIHRTHRIQWKTCLSAREAIELEAALLIEHRPPFNRAGVWQGEPWWLRIEVKGAGGSEKSQPEQIPFGTALPESGSTASDTPDGSAGILPAVSRIPRETVNGSGLPAASATPAKEQERSAAGTPPMACGTHALHPKLPAEAAAPRREGILPSDEARMASHPVACAAGNLDPSTPHRSTSLVHLTLLREAPEDAADLIGPLPSGFRHALGSLIRCLHRLHLPDLPLTQYPHGVFADRTPLNFRLGISGTQTDALATCIRDYALGKGTGILEGLAALVIPSGQDTPTPLETYWQEEVKALERFARKLGKPAPSR